MERLWSPWRYRYVSTTAPSDDCIFCTKPAANDDESTLIVLRAERNFVILNLYPYTNGHLMIAPFEHVATLTEAHPDTLAEMTQFLRGARRKSSARYLQTGGHSTWG